MIIPQVPFFAKPIVYNKIEKTIMGKELNDYVK